jgi:hypothetical protein
MNSKHAGLRNLASTLSSNFVEFFRMLRAMVEERLQAYMNEHRPPMDTSTTASASQGDRGGNALRRKPLWRLTPCGY